MMIVKLLRLGRRQLHTIISRETIKPSSPTPSHIHRYNLSVLDQLESQSHMPLVLLYPNSGNCSLTTHDKARVLKKSLSQSLTQYYPLSGTLLTPTTPYVDCNDKGVEFVEANVHSTLDTFQRQDALDELFPDGLVWYNSPTSDVLLRVQLNHFSCGGIGLAVSMSHLIGDACSIGMFVRYWASVACYGSTSHKDVVPLTPHIIHFPRTNSTNRIEAPDVNEAHVTRKFVFSNSKLSDLKNKVSALPSTLPIHNPTRVEALTSLLYKTAVKAATTKFGFFKPSCLFTLMDIRKLCDPKLPLSTLGNLFTYMMLISRHTNETSLDVVIAEIKKEKARVKQVQSVEQSVENNESLMAKLGNEDYENVVKRSYMCSSLCGFPINKVDFGWGNPVDATFSLRSGGQNGFILIDTPHGDGIEATTVLEKEDMEIFENDKEMLSFGEIKQI